MLLSKTGRAAQQAEAQASDLRLPCQNQRAHVCTASGSSLLRAKTAMLAYVCTPRKPTPEQTQGKRCLCKATGE